MNKRKDMAVLVYGDKSIEYFRILKEHNEFCDEMYLAMDAVNQDTPRRNDKVFNETHLNLYNEIKSFEESKEGKETVKLLSNIESWMQIKYSVLLKVLDFND